MLTSEERGIQEATSLCFFYNIIFKLDLIFQSSFKFTAAGTGISHTPLLPYTPGMCSHPHYQHPHQRGTLVTTDEPAWMHPHHPNLIVYVRVHS